MRAALHTVTCDQTKYRPRFCTVDFPRVLLEPCLSIPGDLRRDPSGGKGRAHGYLPALGKTIDIANKGSIYRGSAILNAFLDLRPSACAQAEVILE